MITVVLVKTYSSLFRISQMGAKFSLATSAYTRGGKPCFSMFPSIFSYGENIFFKGGPWPNGPLNTPLKTYYLFIDFISNSTQLQNARAFWIDFYDIVLVRLCTSWFDYARACSIMHVLVQLYTCLRKTRPSQNGRWL